MSSYSGSAGITRDYSRAAMTDPVEVARRLKAARWLAGGVDPKGKPVQLKVSELAQRDPLPQNRITSNRIEEFEQLVAVARPMELEKIAQALDLRQDYFVIERGAAADGLLQALYLGVSEEAALAETLARDPTDEDINQAAALVGRRVLEAARAARQARAPGQLRPAAPDRPDQAAGGAV